MGIYAKSLSDRVIGIYLHNVRIASVEFTSPYWSVYVIDGNSEYSSECYVGKFPMLGDALRYVGAMDFNGERVGDE